MSGFLEELWGVVQEYKREHGLLQEDLKQSKTRKECPAKEIHEPESKPKRRGERIRHLLRKNIMDSMSPLKTDSSGPKGVNMEESILQRDAVMPGEEVSVTEAASAESCDGDKTKLDSKIEGKSPDNSDRDSSGLPEGDWSGESKSGISSESRENSGFDFPDVSDLPKTPHTTPVKEEATATISEPDSSAALGILNQLSEELCCLNKDSESLATSRHESSKPKANNRKARKTPKKTPCKIKFNFKTPNKSPSGSTNALSKSPVKSPFRKFGYQTPKRTTQKCSTGDAQGKQSVKRKVFGDTGSSITKKRYR